MIADPSSCAAAAGPEPSSPACEWNDLSAAGSERWLRAFEGMPDADVYYHPGYARVLRSNGDGEPVCLVVREGGGVLMLPFLVRSIDGGLLNRAGIGEALSDVSTPYGYGGPAFTRGEQSAALLARYRDLAACEFARRGVVAEFVRFHPVLQNHLGEQPGLELLRRSQTVVWDLRDDPETLWGRMSRSARSSVRSAQRAGVRVEEDTGLRHLESFHRSYLETMRRNQAASSYHYPLEFFRSTFEELRGMVSLFVALQGEEVVSAALILHRGPHAHYHFSGSSGTRPVPGANNLLLHEIALWARSRGTKTFHLGGGRSAGDSLFQFKTSFSPLHLDFWTGSAIHLPEAYERLCAAAAAGRDAAAPPVDPGFFPRYRA